jgi:hypothetical protein
LRRDPRAVAGHLRALGLQELDKRSQQRRLPALIRPVITVTVPRRSSRLTSYTPGSANVQLATTLVLLQAAARANSRALSVGDLALFVF